MNWTRKNTIGTGGFSIVSMAKVHHTSNHESSKLPSIIAVKSASVSKSISLYKEKKVLNKLQGCPYIIRCFGDDITKENGEQVYNLLLEYASGGSLADRIAKSGKGLSECIVKNYTKCILIAVSYIHESGYVHCDIKPDNILLVGAPRKSSTAQESAKLADFGLSKKASKKLTMADGEGFRGTPMYAAPESVTDGEFEPPCDIWALGCTVLEMITGRTPWESERDVDSWATMYTLGFTDELPQIPSWVSKEAQDFLSKCLIRDPESRWTADILLDHPFVSSVGTHTTKDCLNYLSSVTLESTVKTVIWNSTICVWGRAAATRHYPEEKESGMQESREGRASICV